MKRVLLVEDEPSIRFTLHRFLERCGFDVVEAETIGDARSSIDRVELHAAVLDHRLPDGTAADLLEDLRRDAPEIPIVVLTGHGSIELAVQTIKKGADEFLTKPVSLPDLAALLDRYLEGEAPLRRRARRENGGGLDPFVGSSEAIAELKQRAEKIAATDLPVLLTGETGTGKGVLAFWLHQQSRRAAASMVSINCATLGAELLESELFGHAKGAFTGAATAKPGLVEVADGGTLFLDEIGDLDLAIQPKLLRVLEEREIRRLGEVAVRRVDLRLIAATHQPLVELIAEGRFREDLYYRVNAFPLAIPPLRERVEDIPALAATLLADVCRDVGVTLELGEEDVAVLQRHTWPGNIRELRHVLERCALLSDDDTLARSELEVHHAPVADAAAGHAVMTLEEMERHHIERVLRHAGSVRRAAEILEVPRSSLYQKLNRFGISV